MSYMPKFIIYGLKQSKNIATTIKLTTIKIAFVFIVEYILSSL